MADIIPPAPAADHAVPQAPPPGGQAPVAHPDADPAAEVGLEPKGIQKGTIALCLSGGGYRAMLFHAGTLIRLNELGLMKKLSRVSSVSGGSITAGLLGLKWKALKFDDKGVAQNLDSEVIKPLRDFAGVTVDVGSVLTGLFSPFSTISDHVRKAYEEHLYGDATLQDLPADTEGPRFVINATSVQSGGLWRFSRPYMADYKVGMCKNPKFPLALAVTASSAFPPILSPVEVDLSPYKMEAVDGASLHTPPYTDRAVLSDGGVYDNMGLETAWKRCETLLVSDAGAPFQPEKYPKTDWALHSYRVLDLIDHQVRSRRKIELMDALKAGTQHNGAYWGIATPLGRYSKPGPLPCPDAHVAFLSAVSTRLSGLEDALQNRLINWGYASASASLDSWYLPAPGAAPSFPFANDGV